MHHIARITLHLLAGLCLTAQLFAQAPSFNASSVWHEELWRYQGLESHHIVSTITVTGDTMIGGLLYQKLHEEGTNTIAQLLGTPPPPPVVLPFAHLRGALRADGAQWWAVLPGNTQPELLYDFDLAVGDPVTGTFGDCGSQPVVTAIDAVWFNGQMRTRYILNNGFRHLIEGVGASSGLFGYLCQFIEEFSCLQIYQQDQATWPVAGCEALVTSVPEVFGGEGPTVFPNPTTGTCALGDVPAGSPIMLHDAAGRTLGLLTAGTNGTVDLSALAPGTYLLRAQSRWFRVVRA